MDILIRSYRSSDEALLIDLWRRCNLVVPQNDPARDIAAKLAFQPDLLLVAERSQSIVGSAMVGYEGHRGWIHYLAVAPELQREGLGARLMTAAESELRKLGCQKLNLQVRGTNLDVVSFYEQIGYSVDDCVSMGKRLT